MRHSHDTGKGMDFFFGKQAMRNLRKKDCDIYRKRRSVQSESTGKSPVGRNGRRAFFHFLILRIFKSTFFLRFNLQPLILILSIKRFRVCYLTRPKSSSIT